MKYQIHRAKGQCVRHSPHFDREREVGRFANEIVKLPRKLKAACFFVPPPSWITWLKLEPFSYCAQRSILPDNFSHSSPVISEQVLLLLSITDTAMACQVIASGNQRSKKSYKGCMNNLLNLALEQTPQFLEHKNRMFSLSVVLLSTKCQASYHQMYQQQTPSIMFSLLLLCRN